MKLQTQIPFEKQPNNLIGYDSNCLLLGSCFVENIGHKLDYFKFQNTQNPFGIIFNPHSIQTLIGNAIHKKQYSEDDIFFYNEQWHCYGAHSKMSNSSKEAMLLGLNKNIQSLSINIQKASHIIITLGTAWVYKEYKSNLPVVNCHKVPQKEFIKELLTVQEISDALQMCLNHIQTVNTKAVVIFTVSPVRHLKDGFVENNLSKAHLISAVHEIINQQSTISNQQSFYFPSYEIMMDELRDYRFYAEDMLHPNATAINYIWEKFQLVWMSLEALTTMNEVDTIQKGIRHKPFNPNTEAHKQFVQQLELKKEQLQAQFPHISF